ncbi:MAG: helix-turn-helix domain-containing protein [Odoribacter sp.]|nr:helix-turn-helix domain-containing protein [Odoribacter sp.]
MKIISIEAQTFETMMEKFNAFTQKVEGICKKHGDKGLQKWMDNQDVCMILNISKRSLQTYQDNGTLPYTQIGHVMYYKPEDVKQIMPFIVQKEKEKQLKRKERNV